MVVGGHSLFERLGTRGGWSSVLFSRTTRMSRMRTHTIMNRLLPLSRLLKLGIALYWTSLVFTILGLIFAYVTVSESSHRGSHIPSSWMLFLSKASVEGLKFSSR